LIFIINVSEIDAAQSLAVMVTDSLELDPTSGALNVNTPFVIVPRFVLNTKF
jgi:hypothetical protein